MAAGVKSQQSGLGRVVAGAAPHMAVWQVHQYSGDSTPVVRQCLICGQEIEPGQRWLRVESALEYTVTCHAACWRGDHEIAIGVRLAWTQE